VTFAFGETEASILPVFFRKIEQGSDYFCLDGADDPRIRAALLLNVPSNGIDSAVARRRLVRGKTLSSGRLKEKLCDATLLPWGYYRICHLRHAGTCANVLKCGML
jgi:hypothetical protein